MHISRQAIIAALAGQAAARVVIHMSGKLGTGLAYASTLSSSTSAEDLGPSTMSSSSSVVPTGTDNVPSYRATGSAASAPPVNTASASATATSVPDFQDLVGALHNMGFGPLAQILADVKDQATSTSVDTQPTVTRELSLVPTENIPPELLRLGPSPPILPRDGTGDVETWYKQVSAMLGASGIDIGALIASAGAPQVQTVSQVQTVGTATGLTVKPSATSAPHKRDQANDLAAALAALGIPAFANMVTASEPGVVSVPALTGGIPAPTGLSVGKRDGDEVLQEFAALSNPNVAELLAKILPSAPLSQASEAAVVTYSTIAPAPSVTGLPIGAKRDIVDELGAFGALGGGALAGLLSSMSLTHPYPEATPVTGPIIYSKATPIITVTEVPFPTATN